MYDLTLKEDNSYFHRNTVVTFSRSVGTGVAPHKSSDDIWKSLAI